MKLSIQILFCLLTAVSSFAPNVHNQRTVSSCSVLDMAAIDEAVGIYTLKYPQKAVRKQSMLISAGMPVRDIDGKKFVTPKGGRKMGNTFSERDDKTLKASFKTLAKIYGEDNALQMIKDLPIALAFNSKNFGPSLVEFGKIFGEDEARAMVQRNPGLLALRPTGASGADTVDDQTMQFSYIVAATRPAGDFLLYGLIFLLFEPFLEVLTGIPVKENLLALVGA